MDKAVFKWVGKPAYIVAYFLKFFLGNIRKSVFWSSLFIPPLKMLFLLVRLFFMVITTGILDSFGSVLQLVLCSLQPWCMVARAKLGTCLILKNILCQIHLVHLWQRSLTLICNLRVIMMAGNHLVMNLAVLQIPGRKEAVGWHSWCVAV